MEQLHFRTDSVAPAQRFESWRQTLFDTYYRLDCHADDARMPSAPFRGVLESRINGGVRCSRIASSPNRVVRTHGQVRGGEADELGLLVIAGGTLTVDHCGRHDLLRPGDLLAFDNARDYVFDLRSDYDLLCFQLPRELLPQRGSPFERHLGARLPGRNAGAGVLRAYASTLAQRLDPEAVSAVMDDALARGTAIVQAHGGKVLQYAGDNILAAFGADESREDDTERAVRSGLALLDLGKVVGAEVQAAHGHAGFDFRVGIHTGGVLPPARGEPLSPKTGLSMSQSKPLVRFRGFASGMRSIVHKSGCV